MTLLRTVSLSVLLVAGLAACGRQETDAGSSPEFVVVYSSMDESELAPFYEGFRASTGIRVQQVSGDYERLLELMHDRQWRPAADVFLATGSATLGHAAAENVFRPTYSDDIEQKVPARFRDPDHLFSAFAMRPNAIVVDRAVSAAPVPVRYESLAEPEWDGKLCLTTSAKPENIAWVSMLLARHDKREAEMIVRRMIGNLAAPVFDDVPALMAAIESGICGAAIADLRAADLYLATHANADISLVLPSAANGGTQVDVVGAGVTRHATDPEAAVRFVEWLAGIEGQRTVVEAGTGLPVSTEADVAAVHDRFGALSPADTDVSQLAMFSTEAIALVERAHYP